MTIMHSLLIHLLLLDSLHDRWLVFNSYFIIQTMFILFLLYVSAYAAPEPANKIEQLAVVMNYLKRTYIEQLDDNTIAEKAIRGLLNQLDPHSDYLDQKTYKSFKEDSDGGFVGIGM